jgi:hypothetical protein
LEFTGTDYDLGNKPFDVSEPTLLEMPESQDVCAAMSSSSMGCHYDESKSIVYAENFMFSYKVDESEENTTQQNTLVGKW